MSNHFHLLCEVPEPKALSEAEVNSGEIQEGQVKYSKGDAF